MNGNAVCRRVVRAWVVGVCLLVGSTSALYAQSDTRLDQVASAEDWPDTKADLFRRMEQVMGAMPVHARDERVPLRWLASTEVDGGCIRYKIQYQSEPDCWVPAYLWLPQPDQASQKLPAVLCLHQTFPLGKGEPAGLGGNPNLHYAKELSQRGYVVLAPDYPSFGEYDYDFASHPEWSSGTLKAVWDNRRAIDLLQQLPEVNGSRIGCIGHSLGGHNAIFTAVWDERVLATVSSCGFTRFHRYYEGNLKGWTSDRYMPRIATAYGSDPDRVPFDFPELIASLAPRAFFTSSPLHDDNFEVVGVRESIASAERIYAWMQAGSNLEAIYPDSQHDFPEAARRQAYQFMDRILK